MRARIGEITWPSRTLARNRHEEQRTEVEKHTGSHSKRKQLETKARLRQVQETSDRNRKTDITDTLSFRAVTRTERRDTMADRFQLLETEADITS